MTRNRPLGAPSAAAGIDRPSPKHVWLHFNGPRSDGNEGVPVMVSGTGPWLTDDRGKRYYDALSALYCVNIGYGRREIADAMARQAEKLCFFPIWDRLTLPAIALADRVTRLAPPGMTHVFFTGGGSESVDAAWKMARQYHKRRGHAAKIKVVARAGAYHGTSMGALSITGIASLREPFEPLVPGVIHGPRVDPYHADVPALDHSLASADALAAIIENEGPDSVGAIFVEPVQNSGGCLVAEPEYFTRLREICDEYDVLLVSDETICAWGRLGTYFGCQALGYVPDIITTAKGLTSAYAPMGAVIASNRVAEVFSGGGSSFNHGLTFGGHPVSAAAALATLDIMDREMLCARAATTGAAFRAQLEELKRLPIVGDVRGMGLFQAVELVADVDSKAPFTADQTAALVTHVPQGLIDAGIICRAMHRGAPVLQFAPQLIATEEELYTVVSSVRTVLEGILDYL